jgi:hypothetical protein
VALPASNQEGRVPKHFAFLPRIKMIIEIKIKITIKKR